MVVFVAGDWSDLTGSYLYVEARVAKSTQALDSIQPRRAAPLAT